MIRYVDFDGVLAKFDHWRGPFHFGEPITEMVKRVQRWLLQGDTVVVYTARMTPGEAFGQTKDVEKTRKTIEEWCLKYIGQILPVTNIKSYADVYYDDRCRRVILNTGLTLEEKIGRIAENGMLHSPYKALREILEVLKEVQNDVQGCLQGSK